jgi:heat shock protein HslJ
MTEMACQPPLDEQEAWFFALLGAEPLVSLTGDELVLEEGGTVITMLDREVADPDLALVGPTWTLSAVIQGDAVASIPDEVVATLIFTDDGLVMVDTGCNTGGGAVTVNATTIRFGEIALTDVACEGAVAGIERAIVEILGADVVAYAIDARSLTLTIGDRGLQYAGTP